MVIYRSGTPSPHIKKFKREFEQIIHSTEPKNERTPLQLLVIATYLNRLSFIDHINSLLDWDEKQWKFSPGILAQLLVLVPFIPYRKKVAISAISTAYSGMDLELLVGISIDPLELNDDMFGRLLDRIHESGCENLFYELAMTVRMTFSLPEDYVLHSDTTSHVLYGDYTSDEEIPESALHITYGYSKDKRKDLKQIMTGMVTDGEGLVLYAQTLNGNTADCDYNHQMVRTLHSVYGSECKKYVYIADSKLMNEPNIKMLNQGTESIPFISRIPHNFHKKLCEKVKNKAIELNQWSSLGTCCTHTPDKDSPVYYATMIPVNVYGNEMYVHVYRTTDKRAKIERKVDQEEDTLTSEITKLCRREFYCEADAVAEVNSFLKSHASFMFEIDLSVVSEVTFKNPRGRPGKNSRPPQEITRWKVISHGLKRKEENISDEVEKASTFCLLTNLDPTEKGSKDVLLLYKGQSHVERQFSLLKEPLIAATIFLETPERIKALMTILYFSILMHGILRVISHIELKKEANPPRLGNENRPLVRPSSDTMLSILDLFTVVSLKGTMVIESKNKRKAKELPLLLNLVRFDPKFL